MLPETIAERHHAVAMAFADRISGVQDWDVPSPVRGWTARDVVDHLTSWLPGFLQGVGLTIASVPEGTHPEVAFASQTREVQALLEAPDAARVVETQFMGSMPLDVLLDQFYLSDVFMHTWDLARATGQDDRLDPDHAARMLAGMRQMEPVLRESGQFGTQQPVPHDADATDELIAFIGRDPRWERPAQQ